jgi:hypothetical protein
MAPDRDVGLEVEDDALFHRRMWGVQRTGWFLMQLVVLAGLAGLLGSGPLSRAVAEHPTGLRVEHARFARAEAPQAMRVHLPPPASRTEGYRIGLGREFVNRVQIEGVVPQPVMMEGLPDRVVYVFAGGAVPVVTFHFTPRTMGVLRAEVGAPGTGPLTFWLLVYP